MKVYLRILRFAPRLVRRFVLFIIYTSLEVFFGTFKIVLIIPVLKVLFSANATTVVPPRPPFSLTPDFVTGMFNHYLMWIIQEQGRLGALLFVCLAGMACVLLSNIFQYLERMTAARLKIDVVKNLRLSYFNNVSRLHVGYFSDQRKGDLISRFTNDVSEVENTVYTTFKFVLKEPFQILAFFLAMLSISAKLTLFTLIVLPILGGILAELIKRLKRRAKQSQETLGRIVSILDETFGGIRVIAAFNARKFVAKKIGKEIDYHRKVNISIARKNELASPVSETLGVGIVTIILYFGGSLVLGHQSSLQPQDFIGFIAIFASIIQPAKNFSNGITSLQKGSISAERIFTIIDTEPAIKDMPNAKIIDGFRDCIEFKDVSFAYDSEPVLKNVNIKVEKGKTIALVGPSGGGKSTLADLIPRFYDPTEGAVLLDGTPLTEIELDSLRRQMGVVTQESILFNDTIFNNITFGLENVDEREVIRAAQIANAHDFIMQTEGGYQTMIGERGSKLSGGQRQRLAIARAVLKNPPILILDEATSALDSESEKLVQEALTNLMKNRTSVVIAHRLSTIQHADEILVIQEGRIIERGTHADLLKADGLYRKLSELQKS